MCLDERILLLEDVENLMEKWEKRGVSTGLILHELLCLCCEDSILSYKGDRTLAMKDICEWLNEIFDSIEED